MSVRDIPRFIEAVRELRLEQRRYSELSRRVNAHPENSKLSDCFAECIERMGRLKREIDLELGI